MASEYIGFIIMNILDLISSLGLLYLFFKIGQANVVKVEDIPLRVEFIKGPNHREDYSTEGVRKLLEGST